MSEYYVVTSERLKWKPATRLSVDDLDGCNIAALVEAGHLAPAPNVKQAKPLEQSEED